MRLDCNARVDQSLTKKEAPTAIDNTSWRSLNKGFTEVDVGALLGEPKRIEGGSFTF